jgi:hypothetical protein
MYTAVVTMLDSISFERDVMVVRLAIQSVLGTGSQLDRDN